MTETIFKIGDTVLTKKGAGVIFREGLKGKVVAIKGKSLFISLPNNAGCWVKQNEIIPYSVNINMTTNN